MDYTALKTLWGQLSGTPIEKLAQINAMTTPIKPPPDPPPPPTDQPWTLSNGLPQNLSDGDIVAAGLMTIDEAKAAFNLKAPNGN